MNISMFLDHWGINENPFRAEEARQDTVFGRLDTARTAHPDFDKIAGSLDQPSTSIVFGEKGSGKTAIRLQLAKLIKEHNDEHPDARVLLVPYDNLNPILDRFIDAVMPAPTKKRKRFIPERKQQPSEDTTLDRLRKLRLVDHMDGVLHVTTTMIVDALLGNHTTSDDSPIRRSATKACRRAAASVRIDLLLLQVCYDNPDTAPARSRALRKLLRSPGAPLRWLWTAGAATGWILPAAVGGAWLFYQSSIPDFAWPIALSIALAIWGILLLKRLLFDRSSAIRWAPALARQLRVMNRSGASFAESLAELPNSAVSKSTLPLDATDDGRYAMFEALRRVARVLGFSKIIVVLDRIDEPTAISGDPARMQAVVWPLLNNKLLQVDGFGFKLLLPVELRHALFRESSAFFQEARLDKQSLVERLTWTGQTLYDLCNARLAACSDNTSEPVALLDLFAADVTRQDVADALDQMQQPRDAFKFLYQCIQEHASNVSQDEPEWRIPRLVLESVRRQQADRVHDLHRGLRPA